MRYALLIMLLLVAHTATAQIIVSGSRVGGFAIGEPADGGNLDLSATTGGPSAMTLVPRKHISEVSPGDNKWFTMLFRLQGVGGYATVFTLPFADAHAVTVQAWKDNVAPVWKYPGGSWQVFDNYDRTSTEVDFYNNAAFSQNTILISLTEREGVGSFYSRLLSDYFQRDYVGATASGGVDASAFKIGEQVGASVSLPEFSRPVAAQPLYGMLVEEVARTPDKLVLVLSGQHPYEHQNKWTLSGFIEFITSEDAAAQTYRDHFVTLIYPMQNPSGEAAGLWRGPADDPLVDMNRNWDNTDVASIATHKTVFAADIAGVGLGDPVVVLDLHQHFSSTSGFVTAYSGTEEAALVTAIATYAPGTTHDTATTPGAGWFHTYANSTWSPVVVGTMERPMYSTETAERAVGEDYARALVDRAEAGDYGDVTAPTLSSATIDASGDVLTMTFDENVNVGAGGNGGFAIDPSGGAATVSYSSGDGTSSLVYATSRTINEGETLTLDYTQPGDGIEDDAGNDLATFADAAVTNNSGADPYCATDYADLVIDFNPHLASVFTDTGCTTAASATDLVACIVDEVAGDDLTQATSTKRPTLTADGSGWRYLDFDGTADRLAGAFTTSISQPNTIVVVVDNVDHNYVYDGIIASARQVIDWGFDFVYFFAGSTLINGPAEWSTGRIIVQADFDGASSVLYEDNVQIAAGDPGAHGLTGITMASRYTDEGWSTSDIYRLLIYDSVLSSGDRTALYSCLNSLYSGSAP